MFYAEHESQRCGSDWTMIARDLKTIRGVMWRLADGAWQKGRWNIWHVPNGRPYSDGKIVATYLKQGRSLES